MGMKLQRTMISWSFIVAVSSLFSSLVYACCSHSVVLSTSGSCSEKKTINQSFSILFSTKQLTDKFKRLASENSGAFSN